MSWCHRASRSIACIPTSSRVGPGRERMRGDPRSAPGVQAPNPNQPRLGRLACCHGRFLQLTGGMKRKTIVSDLYLGFHHFAWLYFIRILHLVRGIKPKSARQVQATKDTSITLTLGPADSGSCPAALRQPASRVAALPLHHTDQYRALRPLERQEEAMNQEEKRG